MLSLRDENGDTLVQGQELGTGRMQTQITWLKLTLRTMTPRYYLTLALPPRARDGNLTMSGKGRGLPEMQCVTDPDYDDVT